MRSRNHQIKFYISDEELIKLRKNIEKSKLNQSEFLRMIAIDKEIIVIDGLGDLIMQIKRIGVNLNQIAKILNGGVYIDCKIDLEKAQRELSKIWQLLNLLAEKVQ